MHDEGNNDVLELFRSPGTRPHALREQPQPEMEEESCPAYGFLRGMRERANMLEFRYATGNSEALPYNLLAGVRYNPSIGMLLRFSGEVTTMVLIEGSNLDQVIKDKGVNLTDRGILRQRIIWIREMLPDEALKHQNQPTVDRIRIEECESEAFIREWLVAFAPPFLRK